MEGCVLGVYNYISFIIEIGWSVLDRGYIRWYTTVFTGQPWPATGYVVGCSYRPAPKGANYKGVCWPANYHKAMNSLQRRERVGLMLIKGEAIDKDDLEFIKKNYLTTGARKMKEAEILVADLKDLTPGQRKIRTRIEKRGY